MTPRAPALPPDERRAALVEATLPLLRAKGAEVSTREIAEAAGIAEGTIFRVFGSKDELISACMHHAFDSEMVLAALHEVDRTLPLQERLTAAVELLQAHLTGVFALMVMLRATGQGTLLRPPSGAEHTEHTERRARDTVRIDAELTELVGADAAALRVPVQRLLDFLRMLTMSSVHPFMQQSSATAAEIVDVALHGLMTDRSSTRGN